MTFIKLTKGKVALVDPADWILLPPHNWRAKLSWGGWYALRFDTVNGKTKATYMHRLIAHTPRGMICHHVNRNGLDNRRANLVNMTQSEHVQLSRMLKIAQINERT